MKVAIYKILSPSGKVYIGQSWNIERRFKEYRCIKRNYQQKALYSSLNKYGISSHVFEIIHELPEDVTQSVLDTYEQLYMDSYRAVGIKLLNIREAGSKGRHSEATKLKISNIRMGMKYSEETKKRISEGRKGKCLGKSNHMYGIGLTGLAKEQMINSKIGRKLSKETVDKIIAGKLKPVTQLSKVGEFIKDWPSIASASRELGLCGSSISICCRQGRLKSVGGFKWEYKKDI